MPKTQLFAKRCEGYELAKVRIAIAEALAAFGGIEALVQPGERVLLKPNMLAGADANEATTTHPAIVAAMIEQVQSAEGIVMVGDSPAFGSARQVAAQCGILAVTEQYGVPLIEFDKPKRTFAPDTKRRLVLDQTALEADKIINLAKFKSHSQLVMTGPIKNLFGCVSGKRKPVWHMRLGDANGGRDFASMLLDVYLRLLPIIHIVDGIVAMEGNGPRKGRPRPLNFILAAQDAVAIERVSATLVNLPVETPILQAAIQRQIGTSYLSQIEIVGDALDDLKVDDFLLADMQPIRFSPMRVVQSYIKGVLARQVA